MKLGNKVPREARQERNRHRDSADVLGSERGGMMAGAGLLEERLRMCWFFACV